MRILIMVYFFAIATIFGSNAVLAKPTLIFLCGVPVGNRFDEIGGKIQERNDDFTDINPVFLFDDQKPEKLLFVWGATKAARDIGITTTAEEATVVSNTNEKLTAVLVGSAGADIVEMFSLYPTKGLLFYTKHIGKVPGSATFHSACKVSRP